MRQWSPAVLAIQGYQQYISPHKGFCCAFRIDTGGPSCSEFAKQSIINHGFFLALKPIFAQFSACKNSAKNLEEKKKKSKFTNVTDVCFCAPMSCGEAGAAPFGAAEAGSCSLF